MSKVILNAATAHYNKLSTDKRLALQIELKVLLSSNEEAERACINHIANQITSTL